MKFTFGEEDVPKLGIYCNLLRVMGMELGNNLLVWTKYVPSSEGQDPLGLNLRVSQRLGAELFHCITSVTPRARYFSIFPWAVRIAQTLCHDKPIQDTVAHLEKLYTTGCVLSHCGSSCAGGGLGGSDGLILWYNDAYLKYQEWQKLPFLKNPLWDIYKGSIFNIECFEPSSSLEGTTLENGDIDFSELKLSDIGNVMADAYQEVVDTIDFNAVFKEQDDSFFDELKHWGTVAGLCELNESDADFVALTKLFFAEFESRNQDAQEMRRNSLLLLIFISQILADSGLKFDTENFGNAVYFRQVISQEGNIANIQPPDLLGDNLNCWKLFYSHYYLSASLENMLCNLVVEVNRHGNDGLDWQSWFLSGNTMDITKTLSSELGICPNKNILNYNAVELLKEFGIKIDGMNKLTREAIAPIDVSHPLSERNLHRFLKDKKYSFSHENNAIAIILILVTSLRLLTQRNSHYWNKLSNAVNNAPSENITVPVIISSWENRYGDFLLTPFHELGKNLFNLFVIRLHITLGYQKQGAFFYVDESRVYSKEVRYEKPTYGNPRLNNALQILRDLKLLEDDDRGLTNPTERGVGLLNKYTGTQNGIN